LGVIESDAAPTGDRARLPWTFVIYPFMEQQALYDALDPKKSVFNDRADWTRPGAAPIEAYQCPSDPLFPKTPLGPNYFQARGNYPGFVAPQAYWNIQEFFRSGPNAGWGVKFRRHFFSYIKDGETTFGSISDGSSNTMAVSETIKGSGIPNDYRGCILWDNAGGCALMSYEPPNSKTPDQMYSNMYNAAMNITKGPVDSAGGNSLGDQRAFARSFHPGGVNVCLADGAVRFVTASINHQMWRGAATIDNAGQPEYEPNLSQQTSFLPTTPIEPSSISF
jgi:prepilin-type processing-associated H-X9-DG protein